MSKFTQQIRLVMGSGALCAALIGFWLGIPVAADNPVPVAPLPGDADTEDWSRYFGFQGVEITKVDWRSHSLVAGDFNHDGKTDLAIVNNAHSRIDLLMQKAVSEKSTEDKAKVARGRDVNRVESHSRFDLQRVSLDRAVTAMAIGDLDGDGRTDLVMFGEPDRLMIRYQTATGDWTKRKTEIRLPDVGTAAWTISVGDLNNDQRDDIVVLGKRVTYLILQSAKGELQRPIELRNTGEKLGLAMIGDLDGDGRNDLFYSAVDQERHVLCMRLQDNSGRLGPELQMGVEDPRGVLIFDVDGKPGKEIVSIDSRTNHVKVHQLERVATTAEGLPGKSIQYGFGGSEGADHRDVAIADLNGDGLMDVIVTDPTSAQVIVFQQREGGGIDLGTPAASYLGVDQIRAANLEGGKGAEVVVLSSKENTLGISRVVDGLLKFPETLPLTGDVLGFELIDLTGDGNPEIVALFKEKKADGKSQTSLSAVQFKAGEGWQKLGPDVEVKLAGDPARLVAVDANRDGRMDLMITLKTKPPVILLADKTGHLNLTTSGSGGVSLGELEASAIFNGEITRTGGNAEPALLVAQGAFVRNVRLDDTNRWQVADQFSWAEANSKVKGVAAIDLDGKPGNELVLIDSGAGKLRILRRDDEQYRPWHEIDLGAFAFKGARVADLNGDKRPDLLLLGAGKFAVVYAGGPDFRLKEISDYESKLKDVTFADLVAGDLNKDGRADLAVIDVESHLLEVITWRAGKGLSPGINFKIFEEKGCRDEGERRGLQPREAVITDVTGDGRDDLLLLIHDRLLVYPQDGG